MKLSSLTYLLFVLLALGCAEPSTSPKPATSVAEENCLPHGLVDTQIVEYKNLPSPIIKTLNQNSVFAEMKLIKATKVSNSNGAFYSLAFEDEEKFIIRAKFNGAGQLIPYDSQPIEVAQPLMKQPKK
ncbi:hypothetical protein FKX85_21220 [Echinicola soli]|uniref:Lipoprotein n=1 Tax=Echinicola soli TaxID=2591634 RepID=A0A514CNL6_9BACT|nr:hypothetical protein [Echinicola soli]QDH81413.1 hypothetical protein FKX85_21220 [Echinicola soli]